MNPVMGVPIMFLDKYAPEQFDHDIIRRKATQ
jgi:hypothetical protein